MRIVKCEAMIGKVYIAFQDVKFSAQTIGTEIVSVFITKEEALALSIQLSNLAQNMDLEVKE